MCRFLKCHNNSFQAALVYIREVASKYADARKREDERECAMEEGFHDALYILTTFSRPA